MVPFRERAGGRLREDVGLVRAVGGGFASSESSSSSSSSCSSFPSDPSLVSSSDELSYCCTTARLRLLHMLSVEHDERGLSLGLAA